jgi:hypothetical protein
MSTLLDAIKKRSEGSAKPTTAPIGNIEEILAAKQGQAVQPTTKPKPTAIGEQQALKQGQQVKREQTLQSRLQQQQMQQSEVDINQRKVDAYKELQQKGELEAAVMAQEEAMKARDLQFQQEQQREELRSKEHMFTQELNNKATNRLAELTIDRGIRLGDLFADIEKGEQELAMRKDAAQLEQRAMYLSMADKTYLNTLKNIGVERQLLDRNAFMEEANRIAFGGDVARLMKQAGIDIDAAKTEAEFQEELENQIWQNKIAIGQEAIKAGAKRSMWEAGGTAVSKTADYLLKKYQSEED